MRLGLAGTLWGVLIVEDIEMNVLFYLFRNKNILPGDFYRLPAGDKAVIMAMIEKEIELRSE